MAKVSPKTLVFGLLLFNGGLMLGFFLSTTVRSPGIRSSADNSHYNASSIVVSTRGRRISDGESATRAVGLQRNLGGTRTQAEVSCAKLLTGDTAEQAKAQAAMDKCEVPGDFKIDELYAASNCQAIRQNFVTETLSEEEADFPIAFSLSVFKDFYQVEKLFRAVYRPEHFYCFHVDSKSPSTFYQAVATYASCFPNVAMSGKRVDVKWGQYSVLEADLVCMQKLLSMSAAWRYFINLTGQEYPLRTLRELVRILRALNGSNNFENAGTHTGSPPLTVRLPDGKMRPIKWYKGSLHVTVTRGFVEYVFSDVGRQLADHLRRHGSWPCPDETLFATLNHNADVLKVPGADLTGYLTDNVKHPFLNRYKNWLFGVFGYPCLSGKAVRQICIWGVRDLPAMNRRVEFFVNKFYYNFQRLALQCMVERFWNNTLADYGVPGVRKTHVVPLHFYSGFEFVKKHL